MSKKQKIEAVEKPSNLESKLYEKVEKFFEEKKNCEKTGSDANRPISLEIFGGKIRPDVFGVSEPAGKDFQIYMAEGKLRFRGRNFDTCKGQAISLQRFADYVYMFFPRISWDELDEEEKSDVEAECQNLNIGLLIVNKDFCQEKVKAYPNQHLLKKENRIFVKNVIVQYFPDFFGSEENIDFFKRYAKFADTILQESYRLIAEDLQSSFINITPVKKTQSIKHYVGNHSFEFYFVSTLDNSVVFLNINPFGSEVFETTSPILLIEQKFEGSIIKKKDIQLKLSTYIEECLRRKCRVATDDYGFYDTDTSKEILDNIKDNSPENFSIFEQIEILGIEKKQIKSKVEKTLQEIVNFSNSLK